MTDTLSSSSSAREGLSPQNALKLVKLHIKNAHKATDPELSVMFCNEARAALSRMEQPTLEALLSSDSSQDQSLQEAIRYVLSELDEILAGLRRPDMKADHTEAIGDLSNTPSASPEPLPSTSVENTLIPHHIFAENKHPPAIQFKLPACGERITDTPQLGYCLGLLQAWRSSPDSILDPATRTWLSNIDKDADEIDRLMALATDVVTTFIHEGIKDVEFAAEALRLVPVVDKAVYRHLLEELSNEIARSSALNSHQLDCLVQVIQGAPAEYLEAADLMGILELLNKHLGDIHREPPKRVYEFTLAMSSVMDAMSDTNTRGMDRQQLHQSISGYLDGLVAINDPNSIYQEVYTRQALQHIPDGQPIWHAVTQHTKSVKLMINTNAIDVKNIIQQLQDIYRRSGGDSNLMCKQSWYSALRTADALLHGGLFTEFKELVLETPCRGNSAFQWGLCHLLWNLASNIEWDTKTRLNAVAFLEDIHRNDVLWGQHADINQLVIDILARLAPQPDGVQRAIDTAMQHLTTSDDSTGQTTGQESRETGYRRMNTAFLSPATPSLLDRVQDTPGAEYRFHQLRRQYFADQANAVYVKPHTMAPSQSFDLRSTLMDVVKKWLDGGQKVFLLLGSSGSGKSVFSRALERDIWSTYKRMESSIPLRVDMSAIGQPNKDLISSCLRRLRFTDGQIKELKTYRKFILICDEHDPTLRSENLYAVNKLNQPEGWDAKMVVFCRTELLASTSLDCFYPTDEDSQVHPELFQQATIEPFNCYQVEDYIEQYVSLQRPFQQATIEPFNCYQVEDYIEQYVSLQKPEWKTDDYLHVFGRDHCLKDLSRNPLLLSLTLEVLPRLVDSHHPLSSKNFNTVEVYDQIMALWFERSKAHLRESNPAERT
ncbi:hypothetical protein BGX31_005321 [Mortierella sp. GBA43]|nr:hypothetical protein BGX31_005321 [Mortierella sp. GBA43]